MKNKKVLMLVEIAVMVAFSYVLMLFRVGRLPQGGSISLQMLPIFVIALRWGGMPGISAGLMFGLLKLMFDPYIVHPAQMLLDYPLAFAAIGVAGFLREKPLVGILAGGAGRFLMHFLAGVVFFGSLAPDNMSPVLYSIVYNLTYMGPEIVIAMLTTPLVLRRLQPGHHEELDIRNNLIEIVSFVAPLSAMALVVGLRNSIPAVNYAALITWGALAIYHAVHFFKNKKEAVRGLLLVTVPPAVVYVVYLIVRGM
jgi:thiamine transporter